MALGDLLKELAAGARGVGEGVSIGLTRYPAAVALMATRAATGGEPISYEEALKIVREQEAQAEQETPIATQSGRLIGTLLGSPGAAVGKTVGKTLLSAAGRGAVQGGVSGFTANEGMEDVGRDVALGALTGGVLSGAGAGLSTGISKLQRTAATRDLNESLDIVSKERQAVLDSMSKKQQKDYEKKINSISTRTGISKDSLAGIISRANPNAQQKLITLGKLNPKEVELLSKADDINQHLVAKEIVKTESPDAARQFMQGFTTRKAKKEVLDVLGTIPGGIIGAGIGGAGGALAGQLAGTDPETAAYLGALAGGGLQTKQALQQAIAKLGVAASTRLPTAAGETAGRLATRAVVPTLVDRPKTAAPAAAQPAGLTDEQLRMLNEEFDALPESDASTAPTTATKSPVAKPGKFDYSNEYGVPPELLQGVHRTESAFGTKMKSKAGAEGHFQFMPATAKEYGLQDPYDFEQSKQAAARKLSDLHKEYGNWEEALQAYNAGQGTLKKVTAGQKPMPKETLGYVAKVKGYSAEELKKINDEFDALP